MKILPTLRQLRYLVAVVERCHFGHAADDCLVSQSTLSAGIQELEDLLGAQLLERSRRVVSPTPLGREIARKAKALLGAAEDLVDTARAAQAPMSGALHLGVIPTIGPFLLPAAMPVLRAQFPALKLYLREDQTLRLLERLDSGELDAAILALPFPLDGFETQEIGADRFWVVCPSDHRLGSLASVDPSELAFEDLLLLEDGHCLRNHALAACSLEGARRNAGYQGTSLHTLVQMVANGLGLTLVPQMALRAGILRGLDVSVRPLDGAAPYRRIGLVWRKTSGRKETFRRLSGALTACMAELEKDEAISIGTARPA
jgi:LysR family hydrogen peroxide-inducible transcriptional activator